MSRSYRHHNIMPYTGCKSEKYDKHLTNRGLRRKSKRIIHNSDNLEDLLECDFPIKGEIRDRWDFGKDGRCFLPSGTQLFNDKDGWDSNSPNKYWNYYVTKDGHIRK